MDGEKQSSLLSKMSGWRMKVGCSFKVVCRSLWDMVLLKEGSKESEDASVDIWD